MGTSVVWFRRDLRLRDHPALARAVQDGDAIAPLFVVDDRLVDGRWRSPNRLWFLRGSLEALADGLAARGVPLTLVRGDPIAVVPAFAHAIGAGRVVVSRDYTPYGRRRDAAVAQALDDRGGRLVRAPGVLIHEPGAVGTADGGHFRVYSPFRRAWLGRPRRAQMPPLPDRFLAARVPTVRPVDDVLHAVAPTADPARLPPPGEPAARDRLDSWSTGPGLERYAADRDRLDLDATSRLSQDLRFGLLSPVEVADRCAGDGPGRERFLDELAWRDFYAHLLWHEPRIAREAFRTELEHVARTPDARLASAWREGRTGVPVVDAAMRQLQASGWMPNRARMIVAAYLTKQLGVDWRVGEAHFMRHLVDGDPASNNGGWQWAASTGTDAQPWFRVFNPAIQGRCHDPDGAWVRRWLPELAEVSGSAVHEPPPGTYLEPIVDHAAGRAAALAAYRHARDRSRDAVPSKA